jgi:hypothetical protein
MANTSIQIKFSEATTRPTTLNIGEPAYSYVSNTFFIGSPAGTGSIVIGGNLYITLRLIKQILAAQLVPMIGQEIRLTLHSFRLTLRLIKQILAAQLVPMIMQEIPLMHLLLPLTTLQTPI